MRATLEQLKAMDNTELLVFWREAHFPFDRVKGCCECLLQHTYMGGIKCHPEMTGEVARLADWTIQGGNLTQKMRDNLEELYALRLFYDSLYPQEVAIEAPRETNAAVGHELNAGRQV
jgi:hypothetical protein